MKNYQTNILFYNAMSHILPIAMIRNYVGYNSYKK